MNKTKKPKPTKAELFASAKASIAMGDKSFTDAYQFYREAAECLAMLGENHGATQQEMAENVGKSIGWVNALLKWRKTDYRAKTVFGAAAKAARERKKHFQSTEQKPRKAIGTDDRAKAAAASARAAEIARAEAEKEKAEAKRAKVQAEKEKAEAKRARAEAEKATAEAARAYWAFQSAFGRREKQKIRSGPRELLIKALGMLGSDHDGERANAARIVEKQRARLGMSWEDLIIPAEDTEDKMAA
jgi:flagellar biosynthesis GTPase FlhF